MYSPLSHQHSSFLTTNSRHGPSPSTHHPSFPSSSGLQSYHIPANSSVMLAAEDFARLCLSPLQSLPHTSDDHHYTTQNPSATAATSRRIRASPMLLLNDRNVDQELKLIARKLVKKQRSDEGSASGLSLFIILPVETSSHDIFGNHPFGGSRLNSNSNSNSHTNNNNHTTHRGLYAAAQQEFRLYFLCDYGGREDTSPKLHICDYNNNAPQLWGDVDMEVDGGDSSGLGPQQHPPPQQSRHLHHHAQPEQGHALRDLDDFLLAHAIPMLSLLRAVQDNMDAHMPGTAASDPLLAGRIRSAIRFLAAGVHEELIEFQESPSPSEEECDEYESCLLEGDFLESTIMGTTTPAVAGTVDNHRNGRSSSSSSLVGIASGGGALCQMSNPMMLGDGILWMCRAHNEMYCKAPAADRLRQFIKSRGGDCIPMEKSAEIQLYTREDADEFYSMVCEYQCVMKLKISLAWPGGVTEEDLWRLCEVVHGSVLRELTLDCNADPAGAQDQQGGATTPVPKPGFRPLLGILCRIGFVSLTVENHAGDIFPGGIPVQIRGKLEEFSLQAFRDSGESLVVVPENLSLKKLTFRNWLHYPDRDGFASVFKCCPNLQEVEIETEAFDKMFVALQVATNNTLGKLSFLRVMQSYREQGAVSFSRLEGGEPAMLRVQRRTARMMSPFLARFAGLENFSSLACIQMWEHTKLLHDVIHNNIPTLESMEFACRTDFLPAMWSFLVQELDQAQQNLAANEAALDAELEEEEEEDHEDGDESEMIQQKKPVRLRLMDERCMNGLESVCPQQVDETSLVMRTYDATFRPYLKTLGQFATTLSFEQEFVSAEELSLLAQHVAEDGIFFHNLVWHLSPQVLHDLPFLKTLHALVHHPEVQQFTIRIDNGGADPSEVQMSTLLQSWNDLTGMSLDRLGCGRWMQECAAQLDHPFREKVQLPNGGGELMFASENLIEIGATASTMCPSFAGSAGGHRGPRIYVLSLWAQSTLWGDVCCMCMVAQANINNNSNAISLLAMERSIEHGLSSNTEDSISSMPTHETFDHGDWPFKARPGFEPTNMTQELRLPSSLILCMAVYNDICQDCSVIFWDDIRVLCRDAQYLLDGDTIVPFITDEDFEYVIPWRFAHMPGVVIEVVTGTATIVDDAAATMEVDQRQLDDVLSHFSDRFDIIPFTDWGESRDDSMSDACDKDVTDDVVEVERIPGLKRDHPSSSSNVSADLPEKKRLPSAKLASSKVNSATDIKTHQFAAITAAALDPRTYGESRRFRLFFLCGATDPEAKLDSSDPTRLIHLSSDRGYEIRDADEFFDKYAGYALTMMEYAKHGYRDLQVDIPPMATSHTLEEHRLLSIKLTKQEIRAAVDETIAFLQRRISESCWKVPSAIEDQDDRDLCETMDLRQLTSFLVLQPEEGVPGNLYRAIPKNGPVIWMCLDHHRLHYSERDFNATKTVLEIQRGTFDKQLRLLVELELTVKVLNATEVLDCILESKAKNHDFRLLKLKTQEKDVASISFHQYGNPEVLKVAGISIVFGSNYSTVGRTKFSTLFREYGWCIQSLDTNDTFVDHHATILAIPTKGKEYKLTRLVLNAVSLSAVGLGCLDVIIYRSKKLQYLSLVLERLHNEEQFEKALFLLRRYGARLTKLTLSGGSTVPWITKLAEKFPTRCIWSRLRTFQIVCPLEWYDVRGIRKDWDAEIVAAPSPQTSKSLAVTADAQLGLAYSFDVHKAGIYTATDTSMMREGHSGWKEGYLRKRGRYFYEAWKTRYFVLRGPVLKYFDSKDGHHLGSIALTNADIVHQQSEDKSQEASADGSNAGTADANTYTHMFSILEPKTRQVMAGAKKSPSSLIRHVLCAETDKERDDWVEALRLYVGKVPTDVADATNGPERSGKKIPEVQKPSSTPVKEPQYFKGIFDGLILNQEDYENKSIFVPPRDRLSRFILPLQRVTLPQPPTTQDMSMKERKPSERPSDDNQFPFTSKGNSPLQQQQQQIPRSTSSQSLPQGDVSARLPVAYPRYSVLGRSRPNASNIKDTNPLIPPGPGSQPSLAPIRQVFGVTLEQYLQAMMDGQQQKQKPAQQEQQQQQQSQQQQQFQQQLLLEQLQHQQLSQQLQQQQALHLKQIQEAEQEAMQATLQSFQEQQQQLQQHQPTAAAPSPPYETTSAFQFRPTQQLPDQELNASFSPQQAQYQPSAGSHFQPQQPVQDNQHGRS
ncbi:hypothetical protein BGZ72_010726 [Mortierella alpina]|nr:hypothetical protein BGZ72_010726 [Mortierella alpina]